MAFPDFFSWTLTIVVNKSCRQSFSLISALLPVLRGVAFLNGVSMWKLGASVSQNVSIYVLWDLTHHMWMSWSFKEETDRCHVISCRTSRFCFRISVRRSITINVYTLFSFDTRWTTRKTISSGEISVSSII